MLKVSPAGRNRRTVWTIATKPYKGAHFAVFPPALVQPMIKAGTSERGACCWCGAPWERVVEKGLTAHDGETSSAYEKGSTANRLAKLRQAARERGQEYTNMHQTTGWRPTCSCYDPLYRLFPRPRRLRKRTQRDAWPGRWKRVRKQPGGNDWPTRPCVVLDPFGGAGTTALVALQLGRRCVSMDLNAEYLDLQTQRISAVQPGLPGL